MSNPHYTVARERVRWNIVDGQAVLIHTESLYYYSLNRTGTVIWSALLEHPMTEPEIIDAVAKKFGQPTSDVAADVRAFLTHMVAEGLVQSDDVT
jgi:hypothetical protein